MPPQKGTERRRWRTGLSLTVQRAALGNQLNSEGGQGQMLNLDATGDGVCLVLQGERTIPVTRGNCELFLHRIIFVG